MADNIWHRDLGNVGNDLLEAAEKNMIKQAKNEQKDIKPAKENRNRENVVNSEIPFTDEDWLIDSFMVSERDLKPIDNVRRYWSVTEAKFTDTSLGGSISINVYPQFTRYADIRNKGLMNDRNDVRVNEINTNIGMGRYYGEAIDDNAVDVYFQFGVPEFTSLFDFIINAADYKQSVIANEGRSPFMYNLGEIWGVIAIAAGFGVIGLAAVVLRKTLGMLIDYTIGPGRFDYYTVKPTMFTYWSTVNSIVTMFATELGFISPVFQPGQPGKTGLPVKLDKKDIEFMRQFMPDLIAKDNYIDIFSMITRAQRLYMKRHKEIMEKYETGQAPTENDYKVNDDKTKSTYFKDVRDKIAKLKIYGYKDTSKNTRSEPKLNKGNTDKPDVIDAKTGLLNRPDKDRDTTNGFVEHYEAMLQGGAAYAVFRVEPLGSVTESFSNEIGDIELDGMLKGISNKAKSLQYDLAGGVIPGVGNILKGMKDFAAGALDQLTFGLSNVLTALLGNANLNIPKRWIDSSANFPQYNFKMRLISPYGNPISQLRNIYIPLATILAAALPKAAGPSAYTMPFLCNMFVRGYGNIHLGMITSLTISRGVSNLPYTKDRRPLAVDVSFTVTDFSKIMAMPIVTSIGQESYATFNRTSPLVRYIKALTGANIYETQWLLPQIKLNLARLKANVDKVFSSSYWAGKAYDFTPDSIKNIEEEKALNYMEIY